MQTDGDQGGVA